jgi:hypothetical protein
MTLFELKKKCSQSWCGFDLLLLTKNAWTQLSGIEIHIFFINGFMLGVAIIGFLLNHFFIHYFISLDFLSLIPGSLLIILLIWVWASANRKTFPIFASFLLSFFYTALVSFCLGILALAVMLTPSPWILNHQLLQIDQWLGFHQITVLHWMLNHPLFARTFYWAYESWGWQALCVAPVLAICKQFSRACDFLLYSSVLSLVFCLIYIIWPSLPPASVFPQPIFSDSCYACIHRFELLRQHQPYDLGTCGLIDFPSYHAAIAMLAIRAFWRVKGIYLIITILNTWIILATVLLGYHFLVDVIAALFLVCVITMLHHKIRRHAQP